MKKICTIGARGGSKGLPSKNIRELFGKPLIAHSILQAKASGVFNAVAVTSDSDEILEQGRKWGADYCIKRPAEMATDTASKLPAIIHCVQEVEKITKDHYDLVVELDPTSPLRIIADIQGAMNFYEKNKHRTVNVVTAAPARRNPYFNLIEENEDGFVRLCKPLPDMINRRQDAPKCYDINASIYIWERENFFKNPRVFYPTTLLYVMPEERSVDIDTAVDFEVVKVLMQKQLDEQKTAPAAVRG